MSHLTMTQEQFAAAQSRNKFVAKTPVQRMQALGRLKKGAMNKTEEAYAAHLESLRSIGLVAWYKFEGVKLRLADNTFYSPDFAVMTASGVMQMREVKGFMMDDANVKIKVASAMFPFEFIVVRAKSKREGGGWSEKSV